MSALTPTQWMVYNIIKPNMNRSPSAAIGAGKGCDSEEIQPKNCSPNFPSLAGSSADLVFALLALRLGALAGAGMTAPALDVVSSAAAESASIAPESDARAVIPGHAEHKHSRLCQSDMLQQLLVDM